MYDANYLLSLRARWHATPLQFFEVLEAPSTRNVQIYRRNGHETGSLVDEEQTDLFDQLGVAAESLLELWIQGN